MSSVFDRDRLVEQLGGTSIVEELLVMFTASIRQHLKELHVAMKTDDVLSAQRAVHNIKGISGSIYCRDLHRYASSVDMALKSGHMDPAGIRQLQEAAQVFLDTIGPDSSSD